MARVLVACVLVSLCCCLGRPMVALADSDELNRVSKIFANGRDWPVYCIEPDDPNSEGLLDEWGFGFTDMRTGYVAIRDDLCTAAEHVEDETILPFYRALGVLTLIHEAYHVRAWAWRWNEARVECRAIQHFQIGVKLLGGTAEQAYWLLPYALMWHFLLARPGLVYYWPACRVPEW